MKVAREIQERAVPREAPRRPGTSTRGHIARGSLSSDFFASTRSRTGAARGRIGVRAPASRPRSWSRWRARSRAPPCARNPERASCCSRSTGCSRPTCGAGSSSRCSCALRPGTGHVVAATAGHHVPVAPQRRPARRPRKIQPDGIALGFDQGPVFERTLGPESLASATGDAPHPRDEGAIKTKDKDGARRGRGARSSRPSSRAKPGHGGAREIRGRDVAAKAFREGAGETSRTSPPPARLERPR